MNRTLINTIYPTILLLKYAVIILSVFVFFYPLSKMKNLLRQSHHIQIGIDIAFSLFTSSGSPLEEHCNHEVLSCGGRGWNLETSLTWFNLSPIDAASVDF